MKFYNTFATTTCIFIACANTAIAQDDALPSTKCINYKSKAIVSLDPVWISDKPKSEYSDPYALQLSLFEMKEILALYNKNLFLLTLPPEGAFMPSTVAAKYKVDLSKVRSAYSNHIEKIDQTSIPTVDLLQKLDSFGGRITYQNAADHHWTGEGALAAAAIVSNALINNQVTSSADAINAIASSDKKSQRITPAIFKSVVNDDCDVDDFYISENVYYLPSKDSNLEDEDLFGEEEEGIALFGTSFSNSQKEQFPRSLEYFSNRPVTNFSVTGGGPTTSILHNLPRLIEDKSFSDVLWETAQLNNETLFGATSAILGSLHKGCNNESFALREEIITGDYDEWIDVPNFIGLLNTIEIDGFSDKRISTEIRILNNKDKSDTNYSGLSFLRNVSLDDDFSWKFKFPTFVNKSDIYMAGAKIKISNNLDSGDSGSDDKFEAKIMMCYNKSISS